ncbi:4Fe-4S dicluster domain-containing protein [Chloroflexota bacterium]
MKILTVNPDRCVGCRLCELACSLKHTGESNPARARIQVIGSEELFSLAVACFQCEKPYCLEACPDDAIVKDEMTGVVKVLGEKCTGCKRCLLACPFGNIAFSSVDKVAIKCELCDGEPECVLFCPTKALEYKGADTAMIRKKITFAEKLRDIYEGIK